GGRNVRPAPRRRRCDGAPEAGDPAAARRDKERVSHRLEIVERLAHAHHDDVRDETLAALPLLTGARCRMGGVVGARRSKPIVEAIARDRDLTDDLAGREVAYEPLRAGVAERAGERAADLTGEAKRTAVRLRDINAFDLMRPLERVLAGQAQEPFARAVGRDLLGHDFGTCQREMLLERRAQLSRD